MERDVLTVVVGEALAESFPRKLPGRVEPPPLDIPVKQWFAVSGSEDREAVSGVRRGEPASTEERSYVVGQGNAPPAFEKG